MRKITSDVIYQQLSYLVAICWLSAVLRIARSKRSWCLSVFNISFFSCYFLIFTHRHSTQLELHPHFILGSESLWHLLHPGCTRALLHRRVHSVLHHHQTFPVLPHPGQHPGLPAESTSPHLVPNVLLLWVQCQRTCPQWIWLALL